MSNIFTQCMYVSVCEAKGPTTVLSEQKALYVHVHACTYMYMHVRTYAQPRGRDALPNMITK